MGIKGFVTAPDGTPLANTVISVETIDHPVKSSQFGDYWRLLMPGEYVVTATRPGFSAQSRAVTVVADRPTVLNFTLTPLSSSTPPISSVKPIAQSGLETLVSQVNLLADASKQAEVLKDASDPSDDMFVHHDHDKLYEVLVNVQRKCSSISNIYTIG